MAIVSDVEIRLRADIARLQQDMDAARRTVGSGLERINTAVAKTIGTFAGLAAAAGGVAFATFIKNAIDATDKVSDLSQATGVAIKDVAGLQLAFMKGGLEAGAFETSMVKLSKEIADSNEGFKRLGVQTKDSAGGLRSNKDVLYEVADAFQNLEDGTQKTALAIQIFGKSGAALIPLLNEGAEGLRAMDEMAVKLGLTFDEKTVEAAGDFNDTLDFLGLASQGVARQVAAELLPTLQSISGAFLTLITDGNGVSKMAQGIIAVFKVLYTAGAGVAQIFSTIGKTVGAAVAQVIAVLQGDFKTAANIGREWAADLGTSWAATAKSISDVWTGAGGEVVAAMTKTQRAGTTLSEKAEKDAAKQVDAYGDLVLSIKTKIAETNAEAAGQRKINDADKLAIELTQKLAAGKLVLAPAQEQVVRGLIEEYRANLDNIEAHKLAAKELEEYNKVQKEVWDARTADIKSARDEAEANEKLADTFGMTKKQIEDLELARLQERLAQEDGIKLTQDEITHLETLIALKQRSVAALSTVASLEENKRLWESIDKTAHDTFVSIANGGKDTATRLRESFKNGFFDWLYQMTAKPFLVQLQASASGGGGGGLASLLGAAGNAAGGTSGLGSLLGGAGSALGMIGGIGTGALQTAGALITGQIGLGSTVSAGLAALSSGSAAGISAGLASLGGAIIPVLGGVAAAVTVLSKAFGRGPKEVTSQGISGTFGPEGLTGASSFQEWLKKGGWFRSDKTGVDTSPLDAATATQHNATYKTIKDSTAAFATALGLPVDTISSYTKQLKLVLTGDAAKDQAAITQVFADISNELATGLVPNIAALANEGETAAAALGRLAQEYVSTGAIFDIIGADATRAFGAVGLASIEARDRLVQLAGGVESLATQTQFFATNFLSEAERLAPVQKALNEQLAALGKSSITTSEKYKAAVLDLANSGALATEEGAKLYAGLLALGPAFKQVADFAAQGAAEQARVAEQRAALELQLFNLTHTAEEQLLHQRELELAATNALLVPLQQQIYAMQDQATAAAAAAAALEKAAAQAKAVAAAQAAAVQAGAVNAATASRAGASAASAANEQAALERQIIASRAAARTKAAAEAKELAGLWADVSATLRGEVARIRDLQMPGGGAGLTDAQAKFAIATAQARAGDIEAAKALPGLSRALLDLAQQNAVTDFDLRLIQAQTAASLEQTIARTGGAGAVVSPGATQPVTIPGAGVYTPPSAAQGISDSVAAQLTALRQENQVIAARLDSALYTIAKNTGASADLLDKFDTIGMPPERT